MRFNIKNTLVFFICVYDCECDQGVAAELKLVSCDLHMRARDVLAIRPGIWVSPLCPETLQQNDKNVRLKTRLHLQDRRLTSCDPLFLDDISAEGFFFFAFPDSVVIFV